MQGNQTYKIEFRTIKRRGSTKKMRVGVFPWGDYIQLHAVTIQHVNPKTEKVVKEYFPRGTLWRANGELYQRTGGKTSHMSAPDLYLLECMGKHTVHRYGRGTLDTATEAADLREDVGVARVFAEYALMTGSFLPEDRPVFVAMIQNLVDARSLSRDVHQVGARERFSRGLTFTDRLGRFNPGSSAMVTGAGIAHLLERIENVNQISSVVDRKTLYVFEYIQQHLALYRELWDTLRLHAVGDDRGKLQRLIEICEMTTDNVEQEQMRLRAWRSISIILTSYFAAFHRIVALPFRRNAYHTRRDLGDAMRLAHEKNAPGLRFQIAKIRQGISWVFALDFLHRNVLASLRFTLDRLRRQASHHRRGTGQKGPLKIARALDPKAFEFVDLRLADFILRVEQHTDAALKVKVRDRVLTHARAAQEAMANEEWLLAKRELILSARAL